MRPSELRVDPEVAREVAAAHLAAPRVGDALATAADDRLVHESDSLLRSITEPDRPGAVRVAFTTAATSHSQSAGPRSPASVPGAA